MRADRNGTRQTKITNVSIKITEGDRDSVITDALAKWSLGLTDRKDKEGTQAAPRC